MFESLCSVLSFNIVRLPTSSNLNHQVLRILVLIQTIILVLMFTKPHLRLPLLLSPWKVETPIGEFSIQLLHMSSLSSFSHKWAINLCLFTVPFPAITHFINQKKFNFTTSTQRRSKNTKKKKNVEEE